MEKNSIVIKGANEHNLKNVDLKIPRDKLIARLIRITIKSSEI